MKQIVFALTLITIFSFSAFAQNSSCAKIEVTGGGVILSGEPMEFSVKVTGLTKTSILEYERKVSAGTISSGQGTPSITVHTKGLEDQNVTAEVKVNGLYDDCVNTASETGSVTRIIGCPLDTYGKLTFADVKARIQNLYVELGNNPDSQGYIINYGTDEEVIVRERQILKAIKYL